MTEQELKMYSPYEWYEYDFASQCEVSLFPKNVGKDPVGVRYGVWPLHIEEYRSLREPVLQKRLTPYVAVWHQFAPTTSRSKGWRKFPGPTLFIGFYNNLHKDYRLQWKNGVRYYVRLWEKRYKGKKYTIVPLTYELFAKAYAKSTVAREIPDHELRRLRSRIEKNISVSIWGVVRCCDGEVVAGLCAFDAPVHNASHYGAGFYLEEARRDRPMVGLVDHWFAESVQKGIRVMHFGLFSTPGATAGRAHSISAFKSQFVTDYHEYQQPLWRIVL